MCRGGQYSRRNAVRVGVVNDNRKSEGDVRLVLLALLTSVLDKQYGWADDCSNR